MGKVTLIIFSIIFMVSFPQMIFSHVLESENTVGAVIHLSPDDDPIAGQPTNFYFELKDKENKFQSQNCDCTGMISIGGKEIFSSPLFQTNENPSLENASFTYTFPQKGKYTVQIHGSPKNESSFEKFLLSWDVEVTKEVTVSPTVFEVNQNDTQVNEKRKPTTLLFFLLALLLIPVVVYGVFRRKKKSKKLV